MKKSLRLAIAGLCLNASLLWGSFPNTIPTGNALLNTIVTNVCSITMVLQNTNTTGGLNTCGMYTNGISFQSYSDFQSWIAANGSRLANFLSWQSGVSNTRLMVSVDYGAGAPCPGLSISSDWGNVANIAPSSLYVTPTVPSIVLNINGVASATIQFGNNPANVLQIAGNGILVGSSFLTNGNSRMRLSVTLSDGTTATYTQYGNPILSPTMSMLWIPGPPDYSAGEMAWYQWFDRYSYYWWNGYGRPTSGSYNLFVSGTYGADTIVQVSTNSPTSGPWVQLGTTTIPWNTPQWMTQMVFPLDTTIYPQAFFRVKSF